MLMGVSASCARRRSRRPEDSLRFGCGVTSTISLRRSWILQQSGPSQIEVIWLTVARSFVPILPALGTQARAGLSTERVNWQRQQQVLAHDFGQVEDVMGVDPKRLIFFFHLQPTASDHVDGRLKLFLDSDLQGDCDRLQTTAARHLDHFPWRVRPARASGKG